MPRTAVQSAMRMPLPPIDYHEQDKAGMERKLFFMGRVQSVGTDLFLTDRSNVISDMFNGKQWMIESKFYDWPGTPWGKEQCQR